MLAKRMRSLGTQFWKDFGSSVMVWQGLGEQKKTHMSFMRDFEKKPTPSKLNTPVFEHQSVKGV
jgi:hypothetical protein